MGTDVNAIDEDVLSKALDDLNMATACEVIFKPASEKRQELKEKDDLAALPTG